MIIPYDQLSEEALNALIEDFVTRDGTDYGETELTVQEKFTPKASTFSNADTRNAHPSSDPLSVPSSPNNLDNSIPRSPTEFLSK